MDEKAYLRALWDEYSALASLPVMREQEALWYRHNDGDRGCTPIIVEMDTFEGDLLPVMRCETPLYREMELAMRREIVRFHNVGDDRVIPTVLQLPVEITLRRFDLDFQVARGSDIGYHIEPFLQTLPDDLDRLSPSRYSWDRAAQAARLAMANEIAPTAYYNPHLRWPVMYTKDAVDLLGMENYFIALLEEPEAMGQLFAFLREDTERFLLWQQAEGLLFGNTGNDYAGSGSYGFTHALGTEPVLGNLWGNLNSQESVGLSTALFLTIFPYYLETAGLFGKIYWGCCEPVHALWDEAIARIPNLGKVSISPWCDEAMMGERLQGSSVIYSRKPSPNYLGVQAALDEDALRGHLMHTVRCARGCNLEIIFRDVYTLHGNTEKVRRAVAIARECVAAHR